MGSASFNLFPLEGANLATMNLIAGSIVTNTTNPSIGRGKGFTVSFVSTGLYRVTFNKTQPRIISVLCNLVKAAASDTQVEVVDQDPANGYVTFRVCKTSDGSVVAPGAVGDLINFVIFTMAKKLPQT